MSREQIFERKEPRVPWLYAFVVICIASLVAFVYLDRHPVWTSDSYVYAKLMLLDRSMSPSEAATKTNAFYRTTPVGHDPRYQNTAGGAHLFSTRVLYPVLASLLYPVRGFAALSDVSAISYVVFALATYWLMLSFLPPTGAALASLLLIAAPVMRTAGSAALSDMLALALWTILLALLVVYTRASTGIRTSTWSLLFGITIVGILLTLVRPNAFLVLGAALGSLVGALARKEHVRDSIWLVCAACVALAAYTLDALITYGAGMREQIMFTYHRAEQLSGSNLPLGTWYAHALLADVHIEASHILHNIVALAAILIAAIGVWFQRKSAVLPIFIGAILGNIVAIFANPVPWALDRTVELPMYPVIACLCALAIAPLFRSKASYQAVHAMEPPKNA